MIFYCLVKCINTVSISISFEHDNSFCPSNNKDSKYINEHTTLN